MKVKGKKKKKKKRGGIRRTGTSEAGDTATVYDDDKTSFMTMAVED